METPSISLVQESYSKACKDFIDSLALPQLKFEPTTLLKCDYQCKSLDFSEELNQLVQQN